MLVLNNTLGFFISILRVGVKHSVQEKTRNICYIDSQGKAQMSKY